MWSDELSSHGKRNHIQRRDGSEIHHRYDSVGIPRRGEVSFRREFVYMVGFDGRFVRERSLFWEMSRFHIHRYSHFEELAWMLCASQLADFNEKSPDLVQPQNWGIFFFI